MNAAQQTGLHMYMYVTTLSGTEVSRNKFLRTPAEWAAKLVHMDKYW